MVKDTKFYDLLGVSPNVSDSELKNAYRKKAKENHPDLHPGDPEATKRFQAINEAYQILKDPQQRRIYDQLGPPPWPEVDSHVRRTPNVEKGYSATLEDLYNGTENDIQITRHVICCSCNGTGCASGKSATVCSVCDGHGRVRQTMRTPMGFTEAIVECPKCHGMGRFLSESDKCRECRGEKVVAQKKMLHVHIQPGMENGDPIVFEGAASEMPGFESGDIIFRIMEEKHSRFRRNHNDLLVTQKITLVEALLGGTFVLKHLDGRLLVMKSKPGEVIAPGSIKVIEREGMPMKGNRYEKGKLFVKFEVEFPDRKELTPEFFEIVRRELPPPDQLKGVNLDDDNCYTVHAKECDYEPKEEEEVNEEGPQQAQCHPM